MVTRREAELARACRAVIGNWERGDLASAARMCADALKVKASYGRRRAVVTIKSGAVASIWTDKGVKLTIKDEDAGEVRVYTTSLKKRRRA